MNALVIEVVKGHEGLTKREFTANGKEIVSYDQQAYMHNGGAFPQRIIFSHQNLTDGYPVGRYNISLDSFIPDKFGKLTLSPYDTRLEPLAS